MQRLLLVLNLVPALIGVIKAVEEMFPGPGAGKEKLVLIRGILSAAHEGITELWPTLEVVVSRLVEFANATGLFKK